MPSRPPLTGSFGQPLNPPTVTTVPNGANWEANDPRSAAAVINSIATDLIAQGSDPSEAYVAAYKAGEQLAAADGQRTASLVELSDKIVDHYGGQINAFIAAQRQTVQLSGLEVHKSMMGLPGIEVHYMSQFGREDIRQVTLPQEFPKGPEPASAPPNKRAIDIIAVEFKSGVG